MKKILTLLAAVALAASASAENLDVGTNEIRLDGSLDFDTASDTEFSLGGGWGHFIADNIEVGVLADLTTNDDVTEWGMGLFSEINFPIETTYLIPFVGADLSLRAVDPDEGDSENALNLGLNVGSKLFITPDLAIAAVLGFDVATEEVYAEQESDGVGFEDTNWDVRIGLRYFFD